MAYLLIRDIDPKLRVKIERRARAHGRSLDDEVQSLLCYELRRSEPRTKLPRKVGVGAARLVRRDD